MKEKVEVILQDDLVRYNTRTSMFTLDMSHNHSPTNEVHGSLSINAQQTMDQRADFVEQKLKLFLSLLETADTSLPCCRRHRASVVSADRPGDCCCDLSWH